MLRSVVTCCITYPEGHRFRRDSTTTGPHDQVVAPACSAHAKLPRFAQIGIGLTLQDRQGKPPVQTSTLVAQPDLALLASGDYLVLISHCLARISPAAVPMPTSHLGRAYSVVADGSSHQEPLAHVPERGRSVAVMHIARSRDWLGPLPLCIVVCRSPSIIFCSMSRPWL